MKKRFIKIAGVVLVMASVSLALAANAKQSVVLQATSPKKEAKAAVAVTFQTSADYPFEDGSVTKTVTVTKEALETQMLPRFKYHQGLSLGNWTREDGTSYSTADLLRTAFYSGTATFTANPVVQGSGTDLYEVKDNISERTPSIGNQNLAAGIIYTSPSPKTGSGTATYAVDANGFQEALYDLYQFGSATTDYVIYLGGNVTGLNSSATLGAKGTAPGSASAVSFYSLSGKIKSLTLTGSSADPVTNTPALTAPAGVGQIALPAVVNFGTDIELRNLSYSGAGTLAANGYSLTLGGGSYATTASAVYGGSADGANVTRQTKRMSNISIASTGAGTTWKVFGGSSNGTYTGDTSVSLIDGGNATFNSVTGGNAAGTVNGDASVAVYKANTLSNYYGGSIDANVTGSVSNYINSSDPKFSFTGSGGVFYGGAKSGSIAGNIDTFFAGVGSLPGGSAAPVATSYYWYGASSTGNVGTEKGGNTVETIMDVSLFSSGTVRFVGGNETSGIVNAKLINTIRSANTRASGAHFHSVNGGGGRQGNAVTISASDMDNAPNTVEPGQTANDRRVQLAKSKASLQFIGGGDTQMLGGVMGTEGNEASYAHATGNVGYYEGDYVIRAGIENSDTTRSGGYNYVYNNKEAEVTDLQYRVSPGFNSASANRTENSDWDIFGGTGGNGTASYGGFTFGNTSIELNNVLARWTYGGGYSGVIVGNTTHTLNAGLVDTLEGGGYNTQRIYGDCFAIMHNGEVNFFFAGGGWNDERVEGNVSALCTGGFVNAPIGGTYGLSGQVITGNSDVTITGGNLEGTKYPSHANNFGISGGPTYYGQILGNVSLTLDLREAKNFQLPKGLSITGGRRDGSPANIGKIGTAGNDNTVTLNIYTSKDNDVLNGAIIYGDGGARANESNISKIIMNIDTPGASIGSLYATQYSNLSKTTNGVLLRDVELNIKNGGAIGGVSGGNKTDNITNSVATASALEKKQVAVKIGSTEILPTEPLVDEDVSFTGVGLINFTSLDILNGITAIADGGDIKNGAGATAANHSSQYNEFGHVTVDPKSGFGVKTETNLLSLGQLTVNGEASVYSPPGTGKINLSGVTIPDDARLTWHKTGTNSTLKDSTGNYFGSAKAYQVLTFNPTIKEAEKLTPFNFMGKEDSTGKTFVGDSDTSPTTSTVNGYGIMIPGTVIDYKVETPIANGKGAISHNVTIGLNPVYEVIGTEGPNTPVQSGRMIIPNTTANQGKSLEFYFKPEQSNQSWIYDLSVTSTKVDKSLDVHYGEQPTADPLKWQVADLEYSYTVAVSFSNKAEVEAINAIISEAEAALADPTTITTYQKAVGRPFLTSSLEGDTAMMAAIRAGVPTGQVSQKYIITYRADDKNMTTPNAKEISVNLVVMKEGAEIAKSRQHGIYAKDGTIILGQAKVLTLAELNQLTEATTVYADGRANQIPALPADTITTINGTTSATVKQLDYVNLLNSETVTKSVNLAITGDISLSQRPEVIDFGTLVTNGEEQTLWGKKDQDVVVSDSRGDGLDWMLTVAESTPLKSSEGHDLAGLLYYEDGLGTKTKISTAGVPVVTANNGLYGTTYHKDYNATNDWVTQTKGIQLTVPADKQFEGTYAGELTWTVTYSP
ncbi:hypothetical protein I6N95_03335 [Vagococcus sp. BWB3-3]|uniref:WxL domain-containing protein n=1 Tax=Vagococcus allomyrinae TaxID=2794353 RepID=A0A940P233_9ENTE|nr:WxL domain-containing protein [Vagococcus allomyrinae]MBP1040039.1 hypothetical protein [Vagococcus allomyrinae]